MFDEKIIVLYTKIVKCPHVAHFIVAGCKACVQTVNATIVVAIVKGGIEAVAHKLRCHGNLSILSDTERLVHTVSEFVHITNTVDHRFAVVVNNATFWEQIQITRCQSGEAQPEYQ